MLFRLLITLIGCCRIFHVRVTFEKIFLIRFILITDNGDGIRLDAKYDCRNGNAIRGEVKISRFFLITSQGRKDFTELTSPILKSYQHSARSPHELMRELSYPYDVIMMKSLKLLLDLCITPPG